MEQKGRGGSFKEKGKRQGNRREFKEERVTEETELGKKREIGEGGIRIRGRRKWGRLREQRRGVDVGFEV